MAQRTDETDESPAMPDRLMALTGALVRGAVAVLNETACPLGANTLSTCIHVNLYMCHIQRGRRVSMEAWDMESTAA